MFSPGTVESVYGVVGAFDEKHREFDLDEPATEAARESIRERRREESRTFEEFYEAERDRVADGDIADVVAEMYRDAFDMSAAFESEFHEFWDLDRSGF